MKKSHLSDFLCLICATVYAFIISAIILISFVAFSYLGGWVICILFSITSIADLLSFGFSAFMRMLVIGILFMGMEMIFGLFATALITGVFGMSVQIRARNFRILAVFLILFVVVTIIFL